MEKLNKKNSNSRILYGLAIVGTIARYAQTKSIMQAFGAAIGLGLFGILCLLKKYLWKLKLNTLTKYIILLIISIFMICASYFSIRLVSYYNAKKQVESILGIEYIEELKDQYLAQKKIDLKKEKLAIINRINNCISNDEIKTKDLFDELRKIDLILNNRFINEIDASEIIEIRNSITTTLKTDVSSVFLNAFMKAEHFNEIYKKFYCNPIETELYKIFLENGPEAYFNFFEQSMVTKAGRSKLKKLLCLRTDEIQLLDKYLNDDDFFENLTLPYLSKLQQQMQNILSNYSKNNLHDYINKYLPNLLKTNQDHKKIIQNIKNLNEIRELWFEAMGNIIEKNNNKVPYNLDNLIEEKICTQIDNIIKKIGIVYE